MHSPGKSALQRGKLSSPLKHGAGPQSHTAKHRNVCLQLHARTMIPFAKPIMRMQPWHHRADVSGLAGLALLLSRGQAPSC